MKRLFAAAALAAIWAGAAPAMAQSYVIKFAHSLSNTEPAHLAAEYFAKNVGERTNGQVSISVFPSEQLGSGKDVNEMIRQGAPVMNITDPGYLSDFVPDVGVLNGPYLLKKAEDFKKILASDWYDRIDARLQEAGFRVVSFNGLFGPRHILSDKPVRTPADMQGVTIRVPPNQMWIETFRAMGARPTTVNWSEVYTALQQNVVSAVEAPLGSLYGSKLHETRKTLSLDSHFISWITFVMSEQYFEMLPKDIQQVLLEEGEKAGEYMTRLTLDREADYIAKFKEAGVTVVDDVDLDAFAKATESVYSAFPKWTPGLHEQVQEVLNN
ncbi:C4-dicarboxylate TRAP transporter substrate-binding protein [Skermanella mucosa]|uniref:C4-dicarboxylate TRAP transporter substrate-binding protein n=1 Tax=Skermanella mucosa TaxID=1789672 RepID=UPI00192C8753|nr:C4-dicarboxylate TRAP transporter substrate-binding protein [Skermanella mucosa]UEM19172.1 C4-dicarboxylate TRAP transporter substrate-binding protein [Skermanella mucosa]